MESLLEFTIISLLLVLSPGPNGALIFKTCMHLGPRHSLANILGLVTATFLHGSFAIFGLLATIKNMPSLFLTIQTLGALYLVYIGIKAILSAIEINLFVTEKTEFNKDNTTSNMLFPSYVEGVLTQILNPKVSIFYLASFPLFINFNQEGYILSSFLLVSIHASIIFIWFATITILFKKINLFLSGSSKLTKYFQVFAGAILLFFGLFMLLQIYSL